MQEDFRLRAPVSQRMIDIIKHNLLWDVSMETNHNESAPVVDFVRHTLMKSKRSKAADPPSL